MKGEGMIVRTKEMEISIYVEGDERKERVGGKRGERNIACENQRNLKK